MKTLSFLWQINGKERNGEPVSSPTQELTSVDKSDRDSGQSSYVKEHKWISDPIDIPPIIPSEHTWPVDEEREQRLADCLFLESYENV